MARLVVFVLGKIVAEMCGQVRSIRLLGSGNCVLLQVDRLLEVARPGVSHRHRFDMGEKWLLLGDFQR